MDQEERTVTYDFELGIEAYRLKGIIQNFPNHFHEYYVIGFIESGQRYLSCRNMEYNIKTGDIILFNPFDNHACARIDNSTMDYRCLNIKPEVMKRLTKELTGKEYLPRFLESVAYKSELVSLLRELHQMIMEQRKDFEKEEIFFFLMEQVIAEYTGTFSQELPSDTNPEIRSVCEYIEKNYNENITLDDLSHAANINKYSLLRSFTKYKGITPYQYLVTIRINKAKQLLEQGIEPMEAALSTGFTDQSHFTNFFKKFIGLTPKQYQNIFKEDNIYESINKQ